MTANKPTATKFKKQIRAYSAQWIKDLEEPIVGLLKGYHENHIMKTYGVAKGILEIRDSGKYENFHFTEKGLTLLQTLKETTCAFSGKTCKKGF